MTESPSYSLREIATGATEARFVAAWRQNNGDRCMWLLALLEYNLSDVAEKFPAAMKASSVAEDIRESFSIDELILYALGWHTHWGAKAVAWLEQGAELNEEMVAAIDHAVAEKHWTQKDRHIAYGLAQRWKRERDSESSA